MEKGINHSPKTRQSCYDTTNALVNFRKRALGMQNMLHRILERAKDGHYYIVLDLLSEEDKTKYEEEFGKGA